MPAGLRRDPRRQNRAADKALCINHRGKCCTMKIASFRAAEVASYGIVTDAGIIDAGRRLKNFSTLKSLLAHGSLDELNKLQNERRITPCRPSNCCRRFPTRKKSSASGSTTPRILPRAG